LVQTIIYSHVSAILSPETFKVLNNNLIIIITMIIIVIEVMIITIVMIK